MRQRLPNGSPHVVLGRQARYGGDVVQGWLTEAITAHDACPIDHVDAYAAKDYRKAQQLELECYLADAGGDQHPRQHNPADSEAQLPVGDSKTSAVEPRTDVPTVRFAVEREADGIPLGGCDLGDQQGDDRDVTAADDESAADGGSATL